MWWSVLKPFSRNSTLSRQSRYLRHLFSLCFRPEVHNDIISGVAAEYIRVDVPVKFGFCSSNGFRDIPGAASVSNERTSEHGEAYPNSAKRLAGVTTKKWTAESEKIQDILFSLVVYNIILYIYNIWNSGVTAKFASLWKRFPKFSAIIYAYLSNKWNALHFVNIIFLKNFYIKESLKL